MLHTLRSPQRFLCLGKVSHTDLAPRRQLYLLPTCILHSLPRAVQTLPKQGSSLLLSLICVCPQTTGIREQKSPSRPEGRCICYSAPTLENKNMATDHPIQQANPCFFLENPFFLLLTLVHKAMTQCCGFARLPGHSHLISFVCDFSYAFHREGR